VNAGRRPAFGDSSAWDSSLSLFLLFDPGGEDSVTVYVGD
jgi:hypothetical protein